MQTPKAKSQFWNLNDITLTLRNTLKELQKPSATKIYSVGFNLDAELTHKKWIQKSSFFGEIFCKSIKHSDWPRKVWGRDRGLLPPISQKMTRSSPIRAPSPTPNFCIAPVKVFVHPTVTWNRALKSKN